MTLKMNGEKNWMEILEYSNYLSKFVVFFAEIYILKYILFVICSQSCITAECVNYQSWIFLMLCINILYYYLRYNKGRN